MKFESVIKENTTIREALSRIDSLSGNTLFIVDTNNRAIGSVTDGDIRRGFLYGYSLEDDVAKVMSKSFKYILEDDFNRPVLKELKQLNIEFVPLLSKDGEILQIIDLDKTKSILPLEAVIMAGGKGSRLAPLTDNTPKPMLEIGGKPIIEYNIDRLISFGIKKIYISVNYLKKQIMEYFGDGSSKNIVIEYIEEEEFIGTLGSVTYVKQFGTSNIIVMNSDLLTNIDYEDLYQTFISSDAYLAVASVPYEVTIPYGIFDTKNEEVVGLQEKPTYTYYSNAGIYIIQTDCFRDIPQRVFYNATDLIEKLIKENKRVVNFPIVEYWRDIGKPEDFSKAQQDIKHIQF